MKHFKKGILLFAIIFFVIGLVACTKTETKPNGKDSCEHTYAREWEYNAKEHFHRASCEHKDLTIGNEPHQFTEWQALENGKEEQRGCKICDYIETRPKEEIPHIHTYGDWRIEKEPTIDEMGKLSRVCTQDETHIEEFDLPKLNGQMYAYRIEVPSTCSTKGEASYTYDMGTEKLKFTVELDFAPHSYGKWEMVDIPTKDKTGLLQRVCSSNKEHIEVFELPLLNEADYTYSLTPKECLIDGKEIYTYEKDQQKFQIELPIVATGHPFEMMQDTSKHWLEATCEHHLKKEIENHIFEEEKCKICGFEEVEDEAILYVLNEKEDGYIARINPEFLGKSITIPSRYLDLPVVELITSTEDGTLYDGKNIEMISLPVSIKRYGTATFKSFVNLRDVFYEGSIMDWCNIRFETRDANPMHIADSFYQRGEVYWEETTKLIIPNSIKTIGKYQFYGFSHIDEIILPSNLLEIAEEGFAECSGISELFIPDKVNNLGKDILLGTQLIKLTLPFLSGMGSYISAPYLGYYFGVTTRSFTAGWNHQDKLSSLEELTLTNVTSLGEYALVNLPNLRKLSLPNCLVKLETAFIFSGCPNLEYNEYQDGYYLGNDENPYLLLLERKDLEATSFEMSDRTQLIYANVFKDAKITEIELPASLVEIGEGAFFGSSLKSILIPERVARINKDVFNNCSDLEEVILPKDLTEININSTAFRNTNIKKATLDLGAISILTSALEELYLISGEGSIDLCKYPSLKKLILTKNISDLGSDILTTCTDLEYTIEDNIAYLGNEEQPHLWLMYALVKTIEQVLIPQDTTYIYESAFKECSNLVGVSLPYRLQKIEKYAFYKCTKLSYIYFDNVLSLINTIESYAFAYCSSLTRITLPKSLTYIGESVLGGCVRLARLSLPFVGATPNPTVAASSTLFGWIFGNIYNKDGEYSTVNISQNYGSSSYQRVYCQIPASIKEINLTGGKLMYGAFSGIASSSLSIETFTITTNVEIVASNALGFGPQYLTTPYEYLKYFNKNKLLELTLTTPGEEFNLNGSNYYYIQKITFAGIKTITHSNYYVSTLTKVVLPNDLEEIGDDVFRTSTGLESLILPKGIKKIGANAFEATTTLYYLGTEEDWDLVTKESIASPVYFYSKIEMAHGWHYVDDVPTLW